MGAFGESTQFGEKNMRVFGWDREKYGVFGWERYWKWGLNSLTYAPPPEWGPPPSRGKKRSTSCFTYSMKRQTLHDNKGKSALLSTLPWLLRAMIKHVKRTHGKGSSSLLPQIYNIKQACSYNYSLHLLTIYAQDPRVPVARYWHYIQDSWFYLPYSGMCAQVLHCNHKTWCVAQITKIIAYAIFILHAST